MNLNYPKVFKIILNGDGLQETPTPAIIRSL